MARPKLVAVDMAKIDRPEDPVRTRFDGEKIRELAESIREVGLQEPIVLRPRNSRFEIVAGDRRYMAHKLLGVEKIDAIVRVMDDEECLLARATENQQREDLSPMELAKVYGNMVKKLGYSPEKVAKKMGRARFTIKKYLELLDLPVEFQEAIDRGKLGIEVAHCLAKIDDEVFRKYYLTSAVENGITLAVAEQWVSDYARSRQANYNPNAGGGGDVSSSTPDLPVYQTCGGCRGPVEIKRIRYVGLCEGCIKSLVGR